VRNRFVATLIGTTFAAAISLFSSGSALAGPLTYNGINLDAMGLHKSSALPGEPGAGLLGLTFNTGGVQAPPRFPANAILFFAIESAQWASSSYDAEGHKIHGAGGVAANAELLRFVYIYPDALQPNNPHLMLASDLVIPVMVNVHANIGDNSGIGAGGSGIGDIIWTPIALATMGYNSPSFTFFNLYDPLIEFPVGPYSRNKIFNVGNNEYTFAFLTNPVITFPKLNNLFFQSQLQYTHTLVGNNDFRLGGSPQLTAELSGTPTATYATGDLLTINSDLIFPITPKLNMGPTFSWMDQLTNDRWNNKTVKNSGIFALAAGVTMQYRVTPFLALRFRYLRSFDNRNMPQYNVVFADLAMPFLL
jgi:hypothetical protein